MVTVRRTKLGGEGPVTLPKEVLDRLGLQPRDELEVVEDGAGVRVQKGGASPFGRYRGFLKDLAGRDPDRRLPALGLVAAGEPHDGAPRANWLRGAAGDYR